MSSLEVLRDKIDSTNSLESVVHVMKSLSAVSIAQYEEAVVRLRSYQDVVDRGLQIVFRRTGLRAPQSSLRSKRRAILVLGSDWGLCGRFNELTADAAKNSIERYRREGANVSVITIGLRAGARLEALGIMPDVVFAQPGSVPGLTRTIEGVLLKIETWRTTAGLDHTTIVYNTQRTRRGLETREETLLPLDPDELRAIAERPWPTNCLPLFQGESEAVLSSLLRERLFVALMRTGAESLAAEHATRLSAMQAAERNIDDRLEELESDFQRERQNAITTELMDIVTAYQTVAGDDLA